MTPEQAREHFTKLAQAAGLDKDQTAAVLQAMENEKFRTEVSAGYKRHDEFSREMDAVRAEKQRLKDWYEKEEMPKYQTYLQAQDKLRQYQETYGDIVDGQPPAAGNNGANGSRGYLTREDMDKYVEEKLKQRDGAYVGLTKTAVKISSDYARRFQDVLDVDAVEKIAIDKGLPLEQAYKEYVAPKEAAAMEAKHKAEIEAAKAEAVRDYQSRLNLPADPRPREAHPFFDRKTPTAGSSEADQDRVSREEFFAGWNNYEAELKKPAG
ncbi:MAG TPA: hypothetical protein VFC19_22430 [Candidatus Limnocylindrales bacterium]|nr:hypothetical protein [Candidatus Limnocylindrales bacterium]